MLRINKIAAFVLVLLLSCGALCETAYLIDSESIVQDTANYKTTLVEPGEYVKVNNASATIHYSTEYVIRYEGATARFRKYHVKKNDTVKKGDLLATLYVERDEIAITQKNLSIERAKEEFEAGKQSYELQLANKEKEIYQAADAYQREIKRLEKERILIAYERYVYEMQNNIDDQVKSLDELLEKYANQEIRAEVDGVISELTYFKNNQQIYDGTQMFVLYDPSSYVFRVKNGDGLRYNMEVTLSIGQANNRVTGVGRVMASPMALPGSKGAADAYIEIVSYDASAVKSYHNPMVSYNAAYLGNVFVVDRKAVTLYGGKNYVYKLSENGMVSKRYVNYAFGTNTTGALLLDGVSAGEKLIID